MGEKTDLVGRQERPYSKPVMSRVQLRPQEAVLGICKVAGGAGPNGGNCSSPTQCSVPTS
jgi:hypothetical protein